MTRIARAVLALVLSTAPVGAQAPDLRSIELLDYDCSSDIGRRQTTLFANGTVRVRLWDEQEQQSLLLRELDPDELGGFLNRLREVDLSEAEETRSSPAGEWIQECDLALDLHADLPEGDDRRSPPRRFRFGRYDSVSLALSRIVRIAEELSLLAEEQSRMSQIPHDYQPRPGDVLERHDGVLFEVVAFTSDQRGVELRGVDQPLVVYVLREEVIGEFVRVVERRDGP